MKVSTSQFFQRSVDQMLKNQSELSKTQIQLASGLRLNSPSDDPSAAIRIEDLKETINSIDQYDRNIGAAESRLRSEESSLSGMTNLMQRFRELLVQGNNATNNESDRDAIALELRQHLDGFIDLANTQDANDEYIFSGYKTGSETLVHDGIGGFTFQGDEGQRLLKISSTRLVAVGDPGKDIFNNIINAEGNVTNVGEILYDAIDNFENTSNDTRLDITAQTGWEAGDSATIDVTLNGSTNTINIIASGGTFADDFAAAINASPFGADTVRVDGTELVFSDSSTVSLNATAVTDAGGAVLDIDIGLGTDAVDDGTATTVALDGSVVTTAGLGVTGSMNEDDAYGLTNIDLALERISQTLSKIGARRNAISEQDNVNQDLKLATDTVRSSLEDLDYAEASSRFQQQLVALQASQQTYVQIQGLSLFNFL